MEHAEASLLAETTLSSISTIASALLQAWPLRMALAGFPCSSFSVGFGQQERPAGDR